MTDAVAKIVVSSARVVPGTNAGIGSEKPHGGHPHTLNPFAELGGSHRDVLRSAPSEAADVVGRAGHQGVLRPGSDADLLVLGSSRIDAVSAVTDIRAVYPAGHRAR
jgi:imidazolonepropionase-like amidohydrolase